MNFAGHQNIPRTTVQVGFIVLGEKNQFNSYADRECLYGYRSNEMELDEIVELYSQR